MAQVAQVGTGRNTDHNSPVKRSKSRNWCFTLNNYMEAEIKNICKDDYQYIFQEETGTSGTPHLQGLIMLKTPQALSFMKKINSRAIGRFVKTNLLVLITARKEKQDLACYIRI